MKLSIVDRHRLSPSKRALLDRLANWKQAESKPPDGEIIAQWAQVHGYTTDDLIDAVREFNSVGSQTSGGARLEEFRDILNAAIASRELTADSCILITATEGAGSELRCELPTCIPSRAIVTASAFAEWLENQQATNKQWRFQPKEYVKALRASGADREGELDGTPDYASWYEAIALDMHVDIGLATDCALGLRAQYHGSHFDTSNSLLDSERERLQDFLLGFPEKLFVQDGSRTTSRTIKAPARWAFRILLERDESLARNSPRFDVSWILEYQQAIDSAKSIQSEEKEESPQEKGGRMTKERREKGLVHACSLLLKLESPDKSNTALAEEIREKLRQQHATEFSGIATKTWLVPGLDPIIELVRDQRST